MEPFPASRLELGALDRRRTALFICDVQEKYKDVLQRFSEVVINTKKLMAGCSHLLVPLVVSEQSPDQLGHTVKDIELYDAVLVYPKSKFSMMTAELEELLPTLCDGNLSSVILVGMETHVAVEQTAIDLLSRGLHVHVVADCCTARSMEDRNLSMQRLMQIGCFVSTCETVLFKLLESKQHPKYRAVAQLVKTVSKSNALALMM